MGREKREEEKKAKGSLRWRQAEEKPRGGEAEAPAPPTLPGSPGAPCRPGGGPGARLPAYLCSVPGWSGQGRRLPGGCSHGARSDWADGTGKFLFMMEGVEPGGGRRARRWSRRRGAGTRRAGKHLRQ